MSKMIWSEQELSNAAKSVAESMLTSFPSPRECEHVFSDDFEHSMEILRKKNKRRVVAHKIWHRVAVILIVTILSVSTWLTVDIQARERAFQWIKEIYESITIYLFNSEDNEINHIYYEPSWIPDGFSLVDSYQDSDYCLRIPTIVLHPEQKMIHQLCIFIIVTESAITSEQGLLADPHKTDQ